MNGSGPFEAFEQATLDLLVFQGLTTLAASVSRAMPPNPSVRIEEFTARLFDSLSQALGECYAELFTGQELESRVRVAAAALIRGAEIGAADKPSPRDTHRN